MDKGFITIPKWMLAFDLDIYETIILAVIFGFSQDGESKFSGSQNYLATWAKCSRRKVTMALPKLVEMELIQKIDKDVRGVHLCEYRVSPSFIGCEQHSQGCASHSHNNIVDNIDEVDKSTSIYNKARAFQKPSLEEVKAFCQERGNSVDPEAFIAHYESNGWMVGRNKMKNWRQAVITWEKSTRRTTPSQTLPHKESVLEHNLKVADRLMGTNLHAQYYGKKEGGIDEQ